MLLTFIRPNNVNVFCCRINPSIQSSIGLFEDSQASSVCPTYKNSVKRDKGKLK